MVALIYCVALGLVTTYCTYQVEGKLTQSVHKSYSSGVIGEGANSYSTIPVEAVNQNTQINDPTNSGISDYSSSGSNLEQGRNGGVSNSPYQSSGDSSSPSNGFPSSYALYQGQQVPLQSPYFYGSPNSYNTKYHVYAKKHGKDGRQSLTRQGTGGDFDLFPTGGTGATGTGDDSGGGGDLGAIAGLAGLLGLKGLKGLKAALAPFLPILFFPLLLPLLPILLLVALLPFILLLFVPLPVIVTPGRRSFSEGASWMDGLSLRMVHLTKDIPALAKEVLNSEKCVERISCEISRISKAYQVTALVNKMANSLPKESEISKRISRGMAQEDFSSSLVQEGGGGRNSKNKVDGCEVFSCKSKAILTKYLMSSNK